MIGWLRDKSVIAEIISTGGYVRTSVPGCAGRGDAVSEYPLRSFRMIRSRSSSDGLSLMIAGFRLTQIKLGSLLFILFSKGRPTRGVTLSCFLSFGMLRIVTPHAYAQTALEMDNWCRGISEAKLDGTGHIYYDNEPGTLKCWGAFIAVQQLSELGDAQAKTRLLDICAGYSSRVELVKVFRKFMDEHPELGHFEFGQVLITALQKAYPCSH